VTEAAHVIRRGVTADAAPLAAFAARLFAATFGHGTPPDDMAAHLARSYGPLQQARELASPEIVTLVAERDGMLTAFAQLRRSTPPPPVRVPGAIELWRFYVDTPWHGTGLAQALMRQVRAEGEALGASALWLSVWELNSRARTFYARSGFADAGTHPFVVGADTQTDWIMVAQLGARR
jgi:GNAT superfamily N-acetyltransferase